jgi:hypothetical protein
MQCIEAFNQCCDALSIDGTFLTGKYEGTLLIAIGIDADHQLVPLAFAIVEKENSNSWDWLLCLVQKMVVRSGCEIYVISDMHAGILNPVREVILNHAPTIGGAHTTWSKILSSMMALMTILRSLRRCVGGLVRKSSKRN